MAELKHPELVALILAVVDKILHIEKGQVLEAEGVKLHPSELHLLLFLHARPDVNAKEIAERLSITENTVKVHVRTTLEKLHLKNRVQAAVYAVKEGLVDPGKV